MVIHWGTQVIINVVASADTLSGATEQPGYLDGYGVIDAEQVRSLAAAAFTRFIDADGTRAEVALRYLPGCTCARAIRARDLTCRFPGCSRRATQCDIDHTIPFHHANPTTGGLTIPSNLKCLCRKHHRLKPFGDGWRDQPSCPDGTVIWTSPTGKIYETQPGNVELFPEMGAQASPPHASTGAGVARGVATQTQS